MLGSSGVQGASPKHTRTTHCPHTTHFPPHHPLPSLLQKLKSDWENVKKVVSVSEVQKLFRAVDWIGVSAYAGDLPGRGWGQRGEVGGL